MFNCILTSITISIFFLLFKTIYQFLDIHFFFRPNTKEWAERIKHEKMCKWNNAGWQFSEYSIVKLSSVSCKYASVNLSEISLNLISWAITKAFCYLSKFRFLRSNHTFFVNIILTISKVVYLVRKSIKYKFISN